MKHHWLTFVIIFLGVLAASAQQPQILDYDPDDDYLIYINNNTGTLVKTITNAKQINTLSLPSGSYSGVLLRSGIKSGFKIIVK
ncbi:MAG: hypothetical protein IKM98_08505 [Bacteroidales bacterium]|nr:hypothetical protein [Bacteroidales bacterium]